MFSQKLFNMKPKYQIKTSYYSASWGTGKDLEQLIETLKTAKKIIG